MAPSQPPRLPPEPPVSQVRFNLVYLVIAFWGVILLREAWVAYTVVAPVPYSEFQHLLKDGALKEIVIGENELRATLKEPRDDKRTIVVTTRVDPELATVLDNAGVTYRRVVESTFWKDALGWVLPTVFFLGIWWFVFRRMAARGDGMGGGAWMSVGKSKAKVYVETDVKVTFKDVAGVDEALEELAEVVAFLKDPGVHGRLGARLPRGVLLVGPPGTGKTLLARAVAGEAGVPFFSISGSEFVEMFVGVGAARVRDLFEQARAKAPCIIFIDELDALGRARAAGNGMPGHDEKEQTLNQLLVELDGFDPTRGIVLLGATNRPETLDPALLRAGRFDRQVLVDRPDRKGRAAILSVHARKVVLDRDVVIDDVAAITPGFTGADLANLVNEAALLATRRKAAAVAAADFTAAIERIVAGLEKKNRILSVREREVVAHHEMGHALVACATPGADPVHKVSIIPRGVGALGYTIQRPTEDRFLMTRDELMQKMTVLLGGRAAEKLVFDHWSTGAADDLARATDIARSMVMRYGMESRIGHVSHEQEGPGFLGPGGGFVPRRFSEETARQIDMSVRALVDEAFDRASVILVKHRATLESASRLLLEKETLTGAELSTLFKPVKEEPPAAS